MAGYVARAVHAHTPNLLSNHPFHRVENQLFSYVIVCTHKRLFEDDCPDRAVNTVQVKRFRLQQLQKGRCSGDTITDHASLTRLRTV